MQKSNVNLLIREMGLLQLDYVLIKNNEDYEKIRRIYKGRSA